jgi:hypothetical protein
VNLNGRIVTFRIAVGVSAAETAMRRGLRFDGENVRHP